MPLLKRKAFQKSTASEYLRDDDEVFHCEITDEIFKDYEEYCERIILVNSMVWTCEMTGKNNLTYSEALQSEKAARRMLRDFPMELRIPILYLAMKTNRCSFAEMSEDVFNFVRDRYFVGEIVEACLEGDQWKQAHVLSVTAQKQHPDSKATLPAASYVYEVEQFEEADPSAVGQIGTAPFDRVRRRKGVYSRDRNRLFLKQFVEHNPGGVIAIKKSALERYNIHKVSFDQIFTGNPPEFASSKKLLKTSLSPPVSKGQAKPGSASKLNKLKKISPDKKGRQESMDKFVKKTDKSEPPKPKPPIDPAAKKSAQELAEKMRRAEDQMRQRKEEEKAKKKEKTARLFAYLKEWQKPKDDLELEDHKIIPKGIAIEIEGIPPQNFGDFLSVLEFVHLYGEILKVKDIFHNQFDLETFRKALTLKEHAGVFSDLVQMFLTTIFSLQEDEAEDYNEKGGIQLSTDDKQMDSEVGVTKAMELATKASKWPQTYLGTPLSKLPLDPTTVSEVLRLHILSSGSAAGSRCAAWRYQQRGGYCSAEDAGLGLRVRRPDLLRRLASTHLHDLHIDDKFTILQCLMNQILSYATVRDVIEEKLDEWRNTKQALRTLQINERKREAQLLASRQELKKEAATKKEENKLSGEKAREVDEQLKVAIQKVTEDNNMKKKEYDAKVKEMQAGLFDYTSYLGMDRAYRRYWINQAIPGLFVEAGDEPRGPCQDKPLQISTNTGEDTLAYVTKLFEAQRERAGSDKENDSAANSRGNSPKKPLTNLNGLSHKLNGIESNTQQLRELLVCTGDITTCLVHGKGDFRPRWWVYHTEEQIEALIQSLNKRGFREGELRQTLELEKTNIVEYLKKCPLHLLNSTAAPSPPPISHHYTRRKHFDPSLTVPPESTVSEALELSLRDHILELEEKIFHGCLGALKVKDREAWRGTIMLRGYDKQADYLTWGPNKQYRDDYHLPNGVLKVPNDIQETDIKAIPQNKYRDPGHYLEAPKVNGVKVESEDQGAKADVVRGLASALLQVSQAIHHKYLKRPLGLDDKERKEREAKNKPMDLEALERWEVSLMECRSFAQVVLHLLTLDSSITWAASILNASCKICRRKTDPDNMLLCDGCNKGHHLYCLKPQLTKVPEGDWFCSQCKPKEPKTPRKRRKLFSDDDIEDEPNSEEESFEMSLGVCGACGSGGRLATTCSQCGNKFHTECATPRPKRQAKNWQCSDCVTPHREVRRCAATAMSNIHQYTRALNQRIESSESEDSDYNTVLVKLKTKRGRGSKEPSPLLNGEAGKKRGRKSKEEMNASRKSKNSLTNGDYAEEITNKNRKRARHTTNLHTEELHQLVKEVMKHKDCWPFYEPVSTDDVPDYLKIIEQPMDFTTIRNKLEAEEYGTDQELIADVALVFANCFTYNSDTHPVAKAGCRLEKYINRRCSELELPPLPELSLDGDSEDRSKRSSPSSDEDTPKTKRAKLK